MKLRAGRDRKILIAFLGFNAFVGIGNLYLGSDAIGLLNIAMAALFVELLARFFEFRNPFDRPTQ